MSKKKENAAVTVYTLQRTKLSQTDVDNFNAQYEQPSFQEQRFVIKGKRTVILDVKSARGLELQHTGSGISEPGWN